MDLNSFEDSRTKGFVCLSAGKGRRIQFAQRICGTFQQSLKTLVLSATVIGLCHRRQYAICIVADLQIPSDALCLPSPSILPADLTSRGSSFPVFPSPICLQVRSSRRRGQRKCRNETTVR